VAGGESGKAVGVGRVWELGTAWRTVKQQDANLSATTVRRYVFDFGRVWPFCRLARARCQNPAMTFVMFLTFLTGQRDTHDTFQRPETAISSSSYFPVVRRVLITQLIRESDSAQDMPNAREKPFLGIICVLCPKISLLLKFWPMPVLPYSFDHTP
jgi:hypothetical protein